MIREIIFISLILTLGAFSQENVIENEKGPKNTDKGRIVGGTTVDIRKRPFQVALYTDKGFCGGSIIGQTKVVTAAHCVYGTTAEQLNVYVGSNFSNGYILHRYISKLSIHSGYIPTRSNDFDVAVLTTSVPFTFSASVAPIGLLSTRAKPGSIAIVSGWGSTSAGGQIESLLRQVDVRIISQAKCESQYGPGVITSNMVCAGVSTGGKDSCQGDSGGPLTVNGQLAGIVSFGNGCALANYPGVYASVPELRSWILAQ